MDVDQMVDKGSTKVERAGSGEGEGEVGRIGSRGERGEDDGRSGVAGHQFHEGEGANVGGTNGGSERKAKGSRKLRKGVRGCVVGFGGGEIGVEDKGGAGDGGGGGGLQNSDRVRKGNGEGQTGGGEGGSGRKGNAGFVDDVEIGNDVVAKTARGVSGGREAGGRRGK